MNTKKAQVDLSQIPADQLARFQALVAKVQVETTGYAQQRKAEKEKAEKIVKEAEKHGTTPLTFQVTAGVATHVFLDDERNPGDVTWVFLPEGVTWRVIRNAPEFKQFITDNGVPKFVSFDHELKPVKMVPGLNGTDCASWLKEYCKEKKIKFPEWCAHSQTITGRRAIEGILERA